VELDKESKKGLRDYVKDGADITKDILELVEEGIGIAASPATLWLLVLRNASQGGGFSGFISNPQYKQSQYVGTGGDPNKPPLSTPTSYEAYRGWWVASDARGNWFIYYKDSTGAMKVASGAFASEAEAKAYIDAIS
jgi:hypothetical protein